jgi:hypothetical protein
MRATGLLQTGVRPQFSVQRLQKDPQKPKRKRQALEKPVFLERKGADYRDARPFVNRPHFWGISISYFTRF